VTTPFPRRAVGAVSAVLALLLLLLTAPGPVSASAAVPEPPTAAERVLGERAVLAAVDELGVPYAWGGGDDQGPTVGFCDGVNGYLDGVCSADHTTGFDCSGLALYAWYQASGGAVRLAHYTVDQLAAARPVPLDQLIPGDLLFFAHPGGPVHHVGIYLGGGAMIHAEHTGTVVTVLPHVATDHTWGPQLIAAARPVAP
jgi:cell wall-associated NlpC family hydrolase